MNDKVTWSKEGMSPEDPEQDSSQRQQQFPESDELPTDISPF